MNKYMDALNFATQNSLAFVVLLSFLISAYMVFIEVKNGRFNFVFWICLFFAFLSGGLSGHRIWYTIPRVLELLGDDVVIANFRGHWVISISSLLMTVGLIGIIKYLTEVRLGNKAWKNTLLGTIITFLLSLAFAYFG